MFSVRKEGESFKSGINFQWSFSSKPYIGIHFVSINLRTDTVKRWSARLRLWNIKPLWIITKSEYNLWENRLRVHDAVVISRVAFEEYKALVDGRNSDQAREKRRLIANAQAVAEGVSHCKKGKISRFPCWCMRR